MKRFTEANVKVYIDNENVYTNSMTPVRKRTLASGRNRK
jgi:hypothetical protein